MYLVTFHHCILIASTNPMSLPPLGCWKHCSPLIGWQSLHYCRTRRTEHKHQHKPAISFNVTSIERNLHSRLFEPNAGQNAKSSRLITGGLKTPTARVVLMEKGGDGHNFASIRRGISMATLKKGMWFKHFHLSKWSEYFFHHSKKNVASVWQQDEWLCKVTIAAYHPVCSGEAKTQEGLTAWGLDK